jgi:hypothetical protein
MIDELTTGLYLSLSSAFLIIEKSRFKDGVT